ncbi:hypothetical protein G4H71_07610 [Rhodococcus triatomae]|uniref:Uncharacterized protein n=1 Tax=Rhodococcus triatomae TaxID=300028 RepID=A0A1G8BG44_9NOCA|nr:hypothetical protein [Rhodococcus triatomae]QNG17409.1 hypothetical protein G4H72_00435 [Rhodococcus triatomae]QNG22923.1 hypothetical protein G4H71_07610 [Rhodococcus triatomae]SDH32215.1 hypothetical protein SAMN05444695_101855 [Rhodococcus triatomae]
MRTNETPVWRAVGGAGRRRTVLATATVLSAVLLGGCGDGGTDHPDPTPEATVDAGAARTSDPAVVPADDWARLYASYGPRLGAIDCTTDADPVRCMSELADLERALTAEVERSAPGAVRSELLDALDDLEDEIEDYYDDRCDTNPGDAECTEELREAADEAREVHRILERRGGPN